MSNTGQYGHLSLLKTAPRKALEDLITYQCRRNACRKAESPSMTSRMATVSTANAAKMMKMMIRPAQLLLLNPLCITMLQRTSDSSVKGNKVKTVLSNSCRHTEHTVWKLTHVSQLDELA